MPKLSILFKINIPLAIIQSTEKINTIDELVDALSNTGNRHFGQILRNLAIPLAALDGVATWCQDSYTRNCIVENEAYELILICWEEGQSTPIHDHGGEECWVCPLKGAFKETIYKESPTGELEIEREKTVKKGEVTYMIDFMGFHKLENGADARNLTLHLYAKPIRSCRVFDAEKSGFVTKQMSYHTVS